MHVLEHVSFMLTLYKENSVCLAPQAPNGFLRKGHSGGKGSRNLGAKNKSWKNSGVGAAPFGHSDGGEAMVVGQ